jgi:lysozyme family protein
MSNFDNYISKTIEFETGADKSGAYHSDPDDKGGATKWGISKRAHPEIDIEKLTYKRAISIYKKQYYNVLYDTINSERVAFKVFDMGVLMGPKTSVKVLQRTLKHVLKLRLKVDGKYGPMTHAALESANRTQERMVYANLVERLGKRLGWISVRPGNGKFLKGWLKRSSFIFKGE